MIIDRLDYFGQHLMVSDRQQYTLCYELGLYSPLPAIEPESQRHVLSL